MKAFFARILFQLGRAFIAEKEAKLNEEALKLQDAARIAHDKELGS